MADRQGTTARRSSPLTTHYSRIRFGILAHGGVGAPSAYSTGCKKACEVGYKQLETGVDALEAVVETVRLLEEDGRFNAGRGSTPRLDGKTVEMDAAVMNSEGKIGAVIALQGVKNPVLVARRVLETPHVALAGEGARIFAYRQGFPPLQGVSPAATRRYRRLKRIVLQDLLAGQDTRWEHQSLPSLWNFSDPYESIFSHNTVGAVALDEKGAFAAAVSTGGASPMLLGRVGDVPLIGCGFYAGPEGAVAVTGIGEEIVRRMLSKAVYDRIARGEELRRVCREALDLFTDTIPIGIIAITRDQCLRIANRRMPSALMVSREGPRVR